MKGLIFTYVLTYGGAAASILDPFVGLLVYVAFSILKPESLWYWSVPPGNYSRIVAVALLAGWALRGFGNWRFGKAGWVVAALLAYWGWAAFGALMAPHPEVAWPMIEALAKIVLPFLVGITVIDSVKKLKLLTWVIVLSMGYVALELNLTYRGGFNRVWETGFGGMDNNCVAINMVTALGMAFFLALDDPKWWRKAVALAAALMIFHVVLISFSRGGMLALVCVAVVSFLLIPKKPYHYAVYTLALAAAVYLAGADVQKRFATVFADEHARDSSAESRLQLWAACCDVIGKQPLIGLGPNHFPLTSANYGFPPGKEAHTLWLQTGAELGIPGLLFLAGFYLLCVKGLWSFLRRPNLSPDPWFPVAARMVIASLVGFAVSAQFVSLKLLETPFYVVLIGAGVLKLSSLSAAEMGCGAPQVTARDSASPTPSAEGAAL